MPLCTMLLPHAVQVSIRRSLSRQTLRKHTLAGARHHAAATGVSCVSLRCTGFRHGGLAATRRFRPRLQQEAPA